MKSRIRTHNPRTREQIPDTTAQAQPMFQSRPFVVQSQMAEHSQKPDLKKSLRQAEHYGHRLSQMQFSTDENGRSSKNRVNTAEKIGSERNFPSTALSHNQMPAIQMARRLGKPKSSNKPQGITKSRNPKNPALAENALKKRIKKALGKGKERIFNLYRSIINRPINDPNLQEVLGYTDNSNPNAKHNRAKIETTSRDTAIKRPGDLWGHGMNEPSGTRNIHEAANQSAGRKPGVNPTSKFTGGQEFNHVNITEHFRTDTAKTAFPDGSFHSGGLKLNPQDRGFHSAGNAKYDKAMDEAQHGVRSPAERWRKLSANHINETAKPSQILDANGPFNRGMTVRGGDLSTPSGKQDAAKMIGEHRNRLKNLRIKVNDKVDMTNEPQGGTPTVSPVDPKYPVSLPGTPIATDLTKWSDYLNK